MEYSFAQFELDMAAAKPRFFDTWILPAFMVGYAIKSKGMSKHARRILCAAGIYMAMRNYSTYKNTVLPAIAKLRVAGAGAENFPPILPEGEL